MSWSQMATSSSFSTVFWSSDDCRAAIFDFISRNSVSFRWISLFLRSSIVSNSSEALKNRGLAKFLGINLTFWVLFSTFHSELDTALVRYEAVARTASLVLYTWLRCHAFLQQVFGDGSIAFEDCCNHSPNSSYRPVERRAFPGFIKIKSNKVTNISLSFEKLLQNLAQLLPRRPHCWAGWLFPSVFFPYAG